ncbi:MAG: hypothetical protein FWG87_00845 [Defluviitaleaceae bacterium]|nr:hypothetical protein [Defluviitaleaceae bacterium]
MVAVFCRGRIYPSRDYRVLRYWTLSVLELTSVHTSGRINPSPTNASRLRLGIGGGFL